MENDENNQYILTVFSTSKENEKVRILGDSYKIDSTYTTKFKTFTEKNCKIIIDNKEEVFSDIFTFKNIGNHTVKYLYSGTQEELKYCGGMFYNCKNLKEITEFKINTKSTTSMDRMFSGCELLSSVNLSNIKTCFITNFEFMFCGCKSLVNIDASNFDTSSAEIMNGMFKNCKSLKFLDLRHWELQHTVKTNNIFEGDKNIEEVNISFYSAESEITKLIKNFSNKIKINYK